MLRNAVFTLSSIGLATLLLLPGDLQADDDIDLSTIDTICFRTELDNCKVLTAGYFNRADYSDAPASPLIAWQTQAGWTDMDGTIGGFVLFNHDDQGWAVLDAGFDGFFQIPRLNDENLLHVPGISQGTGAFNVDLLYRLEEDGTTWTAIDMNDWLADVELPDGLNIWKGATFDFSNSWSGYVARASLWRADDGNCCPTGGSAVIALEIDGDKLVGKEAEYIPPTDDML